MLSLKRESQGIEEDREKNRIRARENRKRKTCYVELLEQKIEQLQREKSMKTLKEEEYTPQESMV